VIVVIAHNDISFVVEIAKLRKLEFVEESSCTACTGILGLLPVASLMPEQHL
jgi:hypothetical protein